MQSLHFLITRIITSLAILLYCGTAIAAENAQQSANWFQIELVFFEPLRPDSANEFWPLENASDPTETAIEINPALPVANKENIEPFQRVRQADLQLTDIAKRISNSKGYRLLTHLAWVQPVLDRQQSVGVHVYDILPPDTIEQDPFENNQTLNEPVVSLNPVTSTEPATPEGGHINGVVKVSLSRYLHLDANIIYRHPDIYLSEQIAAQEFGTETVDKFALRESRRMRSKETHYFDHPYFGFIARIVPIDTPAISKK